MSKRKTIDEKIDELARAVKLGFDETATRIDLRVLNERVGHLEDGFRTLIETLDLIKQELADMKRAFTLLVHTLSGEIAELQRRVERLERKVGIGGK